MIRLLQAARNENEVTRSFGTLSSRVVAPRACYTSKYMTAINLFDGASCCDIEIRQK